MSQDFHNRAHPLFPNSNPGCKAQFVLRPLLGALHVFLRTTEAVQRTLRSHTRISRVDHFGAFQILNVDGTLFDRVLVRLAEAYMTPKGTAQLALRSPSLENSAVSPPYSLPENRLELSRSNPHVALCVP